MTVYVCAPQDSVSGGPELAHQLCRTLVDKGYRSLMYYYNESGCIIDYEGPEAYRQYNVGHASNIEEVDQQGNIVVVNETSIPLMQLFTKCQIVIWWMSVYNYIRSCEYLGTVGPDFYNLAERRDIYHFSQSEYSTQFLLNDIKIDQSRIFYLSDYLNDAYFNQSIIPNDMRKNCILYNPKKGLNVLKSIILENQDFEWIPIIGMEKKTITLLMHMSKVYIDFGNHPGKDRIPREAAISGMCIITNREGSAANNIDIPIPDRYKFDDVDSSHPEVRNLILDIFSDFQEHSRNFEAYRDIIRKEKMNFENDVEVVFKELIERIK